MFNKYTLGATLAYLASVAQAQTYPGNTQDSCEILSDLSYPAPGPPVYYNTESTDDIGFLFKGESCTPGSYGHVTLTAPEGVVYDCGYIPLDAPLFQLADCANTPRGVAGEGKYIVHLNIGSAYLPISYSFTFTHTQVTSTAAALTSTITTTPSKHTQLPHHKNYQIRPRRCSFVSLTHVCVNTNSYLHNVVCHNYKYKHIHLHANHCYSCFFHRHEDYYHNSESKNGPDHNYSYKHNNLPEETV